MTQTQLTPVPLAMWQEISAMHNRRKHDDGGIGFFSEAEALEQIGKSYGYDAADLVVLGIIPAPQQIKDGLQTYAQFETMRGLRPRKKRTKRGASE